MKEKLEVPDSVLEAVKSTIQVLHDAIEADETPECQIAYRKMATVGSYDSTEGGYFQVIVELIVDERYFLEDGDIEIITDPIYKPEPYKTIGPEVDDKDLIIAGLEEGSNNWKAEYDNCREILSELVTLKLIKDNKGETDNYIKRKPIAWAQAKKFLENYQHQ